MASLLRKQSVHRWAFLVRFSSGPAFLVHRSYGGNSRCTVGRFSCVSRPCRKNIIVKTARKIFVRNFARRAIFLRRSVSSRIGNSLSTRSSPLIPCIARATRPVCPIACPVHPNAPANFRDFPRRRASCCVAAFRIPESRNACQACCFDQFSHFQIFQFLFIYF